MDTETKAKPRRFRAPGDDKGQRYVYTLTRWKHEHTWEHCAIDVRPCGVRWDSGPILTMTWQTGGTSGPAEWYGGKYKLESDSPARVESFARLVRTLKDLGVEAYTFRGASPLAFCEALESIGIRHGAYDPVVSEYRPAADLSMAPMASYRDDWSAYGQDNAGGSGEAYTADGARKLVRISMAKYCDPARLSAWIAAGEPVRAIDHGRAEPLKRPAEILAL